MWHHWPAEARFTFNYNKHWAQILLRHTGEPPVTVMIWEGVAQVDILYMVLHGITLVPLAEEVQLVDLGLLTLFYVDDAAFDGSARSSAHLLKLLMDRGSNRGYLDEPAKLLFTTDTPGQKEAAERYFEVERLDLNFVGGSSNWVPI